MKVVSTGLEYLKLCNCEKMFVSSSGIKQPGRGKKMRKVEVSRCRRRGEEDKEEEEEEN